MEHLLGNCASNVIHLFGVTPFTREVPPRGGASQEQKKISPRARAEVLQKNVEVRLRKFRFFGIKHYHFLDHLFWGGGKQVPQNDILKR